MEEGTLQVPAQRAFSAPPAPRAKVIAITAALVAPLVSSAVYGGDSEWLEVAKGLHPYVALGATHDSNLLRTTESESDEYLTFETGFDAELGISRQRILINGRLFRQTYDRFEQLDHTGGNARVLWKWQRGRLWEGDIGYDYSRKLRDFANAFVPTKDLRDRHVVSGEAHRWLSTRWRLGAEASWADVSFSDTSALNKDIVGVRSSLDYVSKSGNELALAAAYSEARFSNRDDRDYEDLSIGPTLDWRLSGKTRLQAAAAYKVRQHDVLSDRDFEGPAGNILLHWDATGKTSMEVKVWRDISNFDDEIANFAVVKGVSVEPTWNVTTKTALRGLASFERRDFRGSADGGDPVAQQLGERVDEVTSWGLTLDWRPSRNINFALDFRAETRDSDRSLREYDYDYLQARFSVGI